MYLSGGGTPDAVKYAIVPLTRGRGLDIGTGPFKAYAHFIGVRLRSDKSMPANMAADYWVDAYQNLGDFADGTMDFVFIHDIDDQPLLDVILDEAERLVRVGGNVIVAKGDTFDHYTKPDRSEFTGRDSLYLRLPAATPPEKTVCVVRYGAIGDTLQATSILDALVSEGYHITWMCEPGGHDLLRTDPRIDDFIIQDKDQVPNHELTNYWKVWRKKFTRWINLCESVEGTLIALPGRALHGFPKEVRHSFCNRNYLEFTAELAQVPFVPNTKFFPTDEEIGAAEDLLASFRAPAATAVDGLPLIGVKSAPTFNIMWVLSGSSQHKTYPHMDAVIARILLEIPHAHIITVGDEICQILEVGWENEARVHRTAGTMSIRQTLAIAQLCDMVIGPETGIMNAVAFESMPKILFLSHSSDENLSRDWVNTAAIASASTPCYPCHQLHYDSEFCPTEAETGTAMCQFKIGPDVVWDQVQQAFLGRETVKRILSP